MKHLDLFSGIGGFALATEMVWGKGGVEHIFCDNELYAQEILKKHWPDAPIYGDIRTLTANTYRQWELSKGKSQSGERIVDLVTGGFPCQPFSAAGRRLGTEDDRHLWPEMLRVIGEFKPTWVVGENVGGLVTWSEGMVLEQIHLDLEGQGYEVQAFIIPAIAVNAPHRRDRVWIVAHRISDAEGRTYGREVGDSEHGWQESHISEGHDVRSDIADSDTQRGLYSISNTEVGGDRRYQREVATQTQSRSANQLGYNGHDTDWGKNWLEVATALCRVDDGIPKRLDRTGRLKALGNAIVPQVAAQIFQGIKYVEEQTNISTKA